LSDFGKEFAPSVLDLAGVRMLLYRQIDVDPTCQVIEDLFVVPPEPRFRRDFTDANGYQARHRVVTLRDEMLASETTFANLVGVCCEVQVVAIGDHIWNELEHDIKYKTPAGAPNETQNELLSLLREQLNGVRKNVDRLMDVTERQRAANLSAIESPEDLSEILKARTGRRLYGDFGRLLELLKGTLTGVTKLVVEQLPLDPQDFDQAKRRLTDAEVPEADDVAIVISALWPLYHDDFLEISRSWRGRPGTVTRLIQKLEAARKDFRI
jgi:hypothetical protein